MSVSEASPAANTRLAGSESTVQLAVLFLLTAGLIAVTGWWDPSFVSAYSLRSVVRDTAIASLYALGQAIVIIGGGIDLSVGSLISFFGVLLIMLLNDGGMSLGTSAAVLLLVAAAIGAVHGLLICRLDLQPFLVTLCSMLIFRGLARVLTHDRTVTYRVDEVPWLRILGAGSVAGVPVPVFVLLAVLAAGGFFLRKTIAGRCLIATGSNFDAARLSGVRVNQLRILSYVVGAVLTGLAAILETGDVGSVSPSSAGAAYEMYGITGAVLGGCALRGGRGSLLGVVLGMTLLRVLKSTVIFLGISTYWTFAVTGVVLLTVIIVESLLRRRRGQA